MDGQKTSSLSLQDLPPEILLDILSEVEYDAALKTNLQLVSKRLRSIVNNHQHSIAGKILDSQFHWGKRSFPGLFDKCKEAGQAPSWQELEAIFRRTAILSTIQSRCMVVRQGHSEHSAWTTCRALRFHHTGLLLMYRLADCDTHKAKAALLASLPKTSLAIILFTLMVSLHLLRALGPQLTLYWSDQTVSDEVRSDIELACEELLLRDGPTFLLGLLTQDPNTISTLKTEIDSMDARQLHGPDGTPPEMTLIATVRQTFGAQMGCEIRYNLVHMWYVLDEECAPLSDARENVSKDAMEKIVNGEDLGVTVCEKCRLIRILNGV